MASDRVALKKELKEIQLNMIKLAGKIDNQIKRKDMMKRAGEPLLNEVISTAPVDTGNLKNSIEYLPFNKSKYSVFVGPNYRKGGSHAHLVENGFIDRSGTRVEGKKWMRNALRK
jgi:hypothetical protein